MCPRPASDAAFWISKSTSASSARATRIVTSTLAGAYLRAERKRPTGLEPVTRAWKALVLPLHHGRARIRVAPGLACGREPLCVDVERGGTRTRAVPPGRLCARGSRLSGVSGTRGGLRARRRADAGRVRDAGANDRSPLSAHRAPAPERGHGGVGACADRFRDAARAGRCARPRARRAFAHATGRRPAALARDLLRLA